MSSRLKLALATPALALLLGACVSSTPPLQNGASVYRSSEAQRTMYASVCRVESARYVAVVGDSVEDRNRAAATAGVGVVAGALIGRAIGSEIGQGRGNELARDLGTIAGGVLGASTAQAATQRATTRQGVEYLVRLQDGRKRVIVQNLNAGEAPLRPGAACQFVGGRGQDRVIPAA
jgi:outer membrane lipoprotein SlyB